MRLFFFARLLLPRLTDKFSAPITAQALGIAYEDWPRPVSPHAHARLLRLRAPGGLYPRRGSPGRLLQSRPSESAQQSAHRIKIRALGSCRRSRAALDGHRTCDPAQAN